MNFENEQKCVAQFDALIRKDGLLKSEAIAYDRIAVLVARQPLNKMPRLKPLLRKREEWMKRQAN